MTLKAYGYNFEISIIFFKIIVRNKLIKMFQLFFLSLVYNFTKYNNLTRKIMCSK